MGFCSYLRSQVFRKEETSTTKTTHFPAPCMTVVLHLFFVNLRILTKSSLYSSILQRCLMAGFGRIADISSQGDLTKSKVSFPAPISFYNLFLKIIPNKQWLTGQLPLVPVEDLPDHFLCQGSQFYHHILLDHLCPCSPTLREGAH